MEFSHLLIEKQDGIAVLTVNSPKTLNALNSRIIADLECALYELELDAEVKVIVLTGAGKAFVAGADIKEMAAMGSTEGHQFGLKGQRMILSMARMETPVIAAVNGFALGGGLELALACDIRTAKEGISMAFQESMLGLIPDLGGTVRPFPAQ